MHEDSLLEADFRNNVQVREKHDIKEQHSLIQDKLEYNWNYIV